MAARTNRGWVRGEIKEIRGSLGPGLPAGRDAKYIVHYVDYGSEGAHNKDDIISLPKLFLKEPAQAIRYIFSSRSYLKNMIFSCTLMGFILPGKESSSSQVLSNFLDDNNNLSATVHAIVQKGGKELYLVEVFSATKSLRELLEYHNYSKYGEIQIPPSPYYFQSWVSAPPLKRAVETSVNIKSVSEYHSHKVIFLSFKPDLLVRSKT